MGLTRKKFILDKKFQYGLSINAVILPLVSIIVISVILVIIFQINDELIQTNNEFSNEVINTQDKMIEMFLTVPALQNNESKVIKEGVNTFKDNIGKLKKINNNNIIIKENSSSFFYIIIVLTTVQTVIIFAYFIFISHKVSGPVHVMSNYLDKLMNGEDPEFRSLRKNDQLKDFHEKLIQTIIKIKEK